MGKTILGVDIGYDSMKLALVKDGIVKKAVTVSMPKNLLREGRVVSPESMGELIRKAMKQSGIRCSRGALVLPNESVFIRNVVMPVMTEDQLKYNLPGKLEVGGASRDSTGLGALEEGLISS